MAAIWRSSPTQNGQQGVETVLEAISASGPIALGIALSPLPITAIVMMLTTKRAGTNAHSFLLG